MENLNNNNYMKDNISALYATFQDSTNISNQDSTNIPKEEDKNKINSFEEDNIKKSDFKGLLEKDLSKKNL